MAFFEDLTPHTYSRVTDEHTVLNVGWLCGSQPFVTGTTTQEFQDTLADLVLRQILLHRGAHGCNLGCSNRPYGNGQIRVLGQDQIWYSAPILIHHYVVKHEYRPPDEFVSAVLNGIAVMIEPDRIQYWPR